MSDSIQVEDFLTTRIFNREDFRFNNLVIFYWH